MPLPSTCEQIQAVLEQAAQDLFASGVVAKFTPETKQSEWNLAYHLATAIEGYLPELQHDGDLIKPRAGRRRPDIVFHHRNIHRFNYLVIEVKKDGTNAAVLADVDKIKTHWFGGELRYLFGAVMNLKSDNTAVIQVFWNPNGRRTILKKKQLKRPSNAGP